MLNYLLSPTFQFVNTAGRPLSAGAYLEVYVHGTRTIYNCASDFEGTLLPDRIPLDGLGSSVVLADDSQAYDVYAYNRFGSLIMSRYNVKPGDAGISLTSTDGTIQITETENGYDLTVPGAGPSVLTASSDDLQANGQFTFRRFVQEGTHITVDNSGKIRLSRGWFHYTAVARLISGEGLANQYVDVSLYTTLSSDKASFDRSYSHDSTVQLSGDVNIAEDGTEFDLGVTGLASGMSVQLVHMSVHEIVGHSVVSNQVEQVQSDWDETDTESPSYIKNKPTLATVATSGDYNDLSNLPTIPADKVYVFWDFEFNRTAIRAAIDAHKVIMCWNRTTNGHLFFTKYEEVTIDGNLCEIYHFAGVDSSYVTPFASDWRLGDTAFIYDTVRQVQWAEHDTKLFDHEVPSPTSADAGKVLTASWDAVHAEGSWSWQTATTVGTITL